MEAMFDDVPEGVRQKLQEAGYETNDELIIRQVVSRSGKNRIYLGGSLCPLNLLSEIGPSIVHIYGQHEHHTLLKPETHLGLLDAFGGFAAEAEEMSKKSRAGNRNPAFAESARNPRTGEEARGVARRSSGGDCPCSFAAGGGRRASGQEERFDPCRQALPRLSGGRGASL